MKYEVVELFPSIQGEGRFIGSPVVFVRLKDCNLTCKWCDTKYISNLTPRSMSSGEIYQEVMKHNPRIVVLTGGEPLVYDLSELLEILTQRWRVHIETNGTIQPNESWKVDHYIVSPKLPSSGMFMFLNFDVLKWFASLWDEEVEFKFVISDANDLRAMLNLLRDLEWKKEREVILQPVNNDIGIARSLASWILEHEAWNFRILPQWHKLLRVR